MKKAKEILKEMEFKNWQELKDFIVNTLSEKYGSGTLYHDIEKFDNIEDQLNYYIKSEIIFFLDVYRKNVYPNHRYEKPNNYAAVSVGSILQDDIRNIKNKLSDKNMYPAVSMLLERIQEAYECYQFLETLAESEGDDQ